MGNPFKIALREGRPQIGLWLALADAYCAEVCAAAGYDWLLIDGEHAPNDLRTILAQLQALAAYPAAPVVRIAAADPVAIKQVLDLGAQSIMVPMIETGDQARAMAADMRYPPAGTRGVGSGLARVSRWGRRAGYVHEAGDEVCLILQVESRLGLENLAEIAAADGVDGVFIGAADLAADMGLLGQAGHESVVAAVLAGLRTIAGAGKASGVLTGDPGLTRAYLAAGARFVAVGADSSLLAKAADDLLAGSRALFAEVLSGPAGGGHG